MAGRGAEHPSPLMAGLVRGLADGQCDTRKATVLVLVECCAALGDSALPLLAKHLTQPQLKLVHIYVTKRGGQPQVK